ncbi:MAG: aminomethyl-transferring glycine dehydrogenase subunit GcvPB [Clostridiales bacterium]|nr:aminomethyl-transferring glycine dehydrogenase subunit GcvPB [Clostridiales bacterium]
MKLIFERSRPGRGMAVVPKSDVPPSPLPQNMLRAGRPALPEVPESELCRHYKELSGAAFGVSDGFYPLGSCTMKHNPRVNEEIASLPGFAEAHPLQPAEASQGGMAALFQLEQALCEITGMDAFTFQPSAGAHGELTGLMLIRAYHESRGDDGRVEIIVPDSAHGTNPASAAMAGFAVKSVPSGADGCVDLDALRAAAGPRTAGIMLTNPNTLGVFEREIAQITRIVRDAGGLSYYDGANLNAVMGVVRPGDMGFDVVHLNLHKTFSTPHGGGGPGSGPVGVKKPLADFLPAPVVTQKGGIYEWARPGRTIGRVRSFYGNFLVAVRALAYLKALGGDGVPRAAAGAVLNANYMKHALEGEAEMAAPGLCMHEFVMSLRELRRQTGVSALDVSKALIDRGMHPPTMYFPLIVHEALMLEPTETETREGLDQAIQSIREVLAQARTQPDALKAAPVTTPIGRPDEVRAARNPRIVWQG